MSVSISLGPEKLNSLGESVLIFSILVTRSFEITHKLYFIMCMHNYLVYGSFFNFLQV